MVPMFRRIGARRALTAVLALGLVGVVAVPAIYAASSAASPAAQAPVEPAPVDPAAAATGAAGQVDAAALAPAAVRLEGLLKRVVRGDLTVRTKGGALVLVHYERGKVSAVSSTSITITGPDDKGATFAVTAATRVRSAGKLEAIGDLTVGQNAIVLGTGSDGTYTAVLVRGIVARPATQGPPAPSASTAP